MAHESFEDRDVAALLNRRFVAIKVDREERPDIDRIYMAVCQALTGRGGWPLSIFMTPEGRPFFAGTYFPKTGRMGIPGFTAVLEQIAALWEKDRKRITTSAEMITAAINAAPPPASANAMLQESALRLGFEQLSHAFDPVWGGFSSAPKFPLPHNLTFLLRWYKRSNDPGALAMVEKTLIEMSKGGMFDHVGFGFHRYSVDEKWLVPHFEKMLYDQALLALAYLEAFQITRDTNFKRTAEKIFTYVLRNLTSPEGGFYSAEDADSEGKEGCFYVWTQPEIQSVLGTELGDLFCRFYNITPDGNFEAGTSIPHQTVPAKDFATQEGIDLEELKKKLETGRELLFEVRKKRIHPLKDDKIITAWNGIMIAAFAKGYQILGEADYADAAQKSARFILKNLRNSEGRILRRFRAQEAAVPGFLEDYSFLVGGLLDLYEAVFEIDYLEEAVTITRAMIDIFWDDKDGGFFYSGKGNEPLIAQSKDVYDSAIPSGNAVAALTMFRLSRMTGDRDLENKADRMMKTFSSRISANPLAAPYFLQALDFALGPAQEIVIAGDKKNRTTQDMIRVIQQTFLPHKVLLLRNDGSEGERLAKLSSLATSVVPNKKTTVYVCEQFTCQKPMTDIKEVQTFLDRC